MEELEKMVRQWCADNSIRLVKVEGVVNGELTATVKLTRDTVMTFKRNSESLDVWTR